jgi:hypothetical protein
MSFSSEITADTPLLYYRCQDTSGTTCTDETANNNDGTYSGGFTLEETSLVSNDEGADTSVLLDGIDGKIVTPGLAISSETSVTVAVIIKPDKSFGDSQVPLFSVAYSGIKSTLWLSHDGGFIGLHDVSSDRMSTVKLPKVARKWMFHVLFTSSLEVYLDGKSVWTSASNTVLSNQTVTFSFGHAVSHSTKYVKGHFDEIAIFNSALSGDRITAHYEEFALQDKTREVTHTRLVRARRSIQLPINHIGI